MNMLVPKSMIFIPTFEWCFISTFYGLRSLWMIPSSLRKASDASNCMAKALILWRSRGLKWFASRSWYRLVARSSVMMQICLRNTIKSLILNRFFLFSISCSLIFMRMLISLSASCICSLPALTIFTATVSRVLWSNAFTTSPNAPLPSPSISS